MANNKIVQAVPKPEIQPKPQETTQLEPPSNSQEKKPRPWSTIVLLILLLASLGITGFFVYQNDQLKRQIRSQEQPALPVVPEPTLIPKTYQPIEHYFPPIIQKSPSYTLIFVGDSMTESLGENFDDLRLDLKKYYPEKNFGLFNYGFGSSNILSIEDRLNYDTVYQGKIFPAILSRDFDLILIESLGNNPLSQFSLDEGLQIQTAALDYMVAELTDTHPDSLIIFIATIAPSQTLYGIGAVDLSPTERNQWANERRAYIENHINYAKSHNIPLINIYEKTLDKNGLAITKYLNSSDYIHPSAEGVSLISQTIADYLYQNHILLN